MSIFNSSRSSRLLLHSFVISTPDWPHLGQSVGKHRKAVGNKKQPISQLEHDVASSFFFTLSLGKEVERHWRRKGTGSSGRDVNIWGLLETEGVPSCSPDLRRARDRTMGMTLLLSHALEEHSSCKVPNILFYSFTFICESTKELC